MNQETDSAGYRVLLNAYINRFFKALRSRRFEGIAELLDQMRALPLHPDAQEWATYFSGILADEQARDWATAERIYHHLLNDPLDPVLRAHVLLSLGIAYHKYARWRDSVSRCIESATLWSSLGYPIKQAVVLRQLAISYHSGFTGGEFGPEVLEQAIAHCTTALDLLAACTPTTPDPPLYKSDVLLYQAVSWNTLGNIYSCTGNWERAIDCYQHFLALCEQRNDRFHTGFALESLAGAYQRHNPQHWPAAHDLYERAIAIFQEFQDSYNEFFALAHQGLLYQKQGDYHDGLLHYEQALALIEQVRTGITSEDVRSGFSATVTNIYANALLAQIDRGNIHEAFYWAERSRSRAFLDSLMIGKTDFSGRVAATPLTPKAVQASLSSDAIVLAYFTTGVFEPHGGRVTARQAARTVLFPTAKTFLFVVTYDTLDGFDLDLDPNQLYPQAQEQWVEGHFLQAQIRSLLYHKLVQPCEHLLRNKQHIYLIPHGPLHYIPWHALLASDGETWLRPNGPTFIYAPSASVLLQPRPQRGGPPSGSGLAIGYNGQDPVRLRFAEEEAHHVAHTLKGEALVGSGSTLATLVSQVAGYRILHFSCHGEFNLDSPLLSKLYIGPDETLTGQAILETFRLSCYLVTLSACESGLSRVQRGDELYGLVRAFLSVGARTVVASLWRVNDCATLLLMERFYRELCAGVAVAEALKRAQLHVKLLRRHEVHTALQRLLPDHSTTDLGVPPGAEDDLIFAAPHYWAGFVLIGDPAQTITPLSSQQV